MKSSPTRAAAVTAALLMAGAIFGSVAAMAGALIAVSITEGVSAALPVLGFAGILGGVLGALLLPGTSWLLLRRVPLGLSWLGTTVGTVIGGVAGWVGASLIGTNPLLTPIGAAIAGFFLAVIVLRVRFSRPAESRVAVARPAA